MGFFGLKRTPKPLLNENGEPWPGDEPKCLEREYESGRKVYVICTARKFTVPYWGGVYDHWYWGRVDGCSADGYETPEQAWAAVKDANVKSVRVVG